ncbi:MAG: MobF family relaxase [Elusimicrobia bacterium]|nr:MobF family relaxase [Elusimicrobiota bacterium]
MLTAMKLTGNPESIAAYHSGQENYYFKQATEDEKQIIRAGFHPEREESLEYVKVHGKLCEDMGLEAGQQINEATFRNLLHGRDSSGNQQSKKHKVTGIDLTFSAPKSVSIAGLVSDKDPLIIQEHDQAVLDTMKEIEENHSVARPTSRTSWHTGKMIYVTARDGFSREHDPHLHTHVVVMNLTKHKDKIMGLWSREILNRDFNKLWGAVYRTNLANRLKAKGYNITYTKNGEWRLDKVSLTAEVEFSTRRKQILEAEANGKLDMDAWRKTRKEKEPTVNKDDIITNWQQRLARTNKENENQNREQVGKERTVWATKAEWSIEAYQERNGYRNNTTDLEKWQLAIRRATEKSATVSKQAVITEYLTELMRGGQFEDITYKEATNRLQHQVQIGHIIQLEDERYTSWEMMKAEREYMSETGLKLSNWERYTPEQTSQIIEGQRKEKLKAGLRTLSELQSLAVQKMITSNTRLTIVQGDAGAGKTTALKTTADFYKERGIEVIGLAMQGVAAKNLKEETGIKSTTVSSFLLQKEHKKNRVIVIDEASMLDSRSAAQLFKIANKNNDKVILVGDCNQLESISAGKVFERLVNDSGQAGDLINLTENFRQRDKELKEAVENARTGQMSKSLDILDMRGDIVEVSDSQDRRQKIAELYNSDTLIITGTTAAKDEINLRIRFELTSQGKLNNSESKSYKMVRRDSDGIEHERELKLAKNDVITFCKNDYKEYDIRNGERGKIIGLDERYLKIELEDKRKITIDTDKYKNIDYGYALTTYKAQGQTYNRVVVESDTAVPTLNDMRNQYVNITRARDDIKIFTDDKEYLKELADIKTHARDTLSESYTLQDTIAAEERLWNNIRANLSKETKYQEPAVQNRAVIEKQQNSRTPEQ